MHPNDRLALCLLVDASADTARESGQRQRVLRAEAAQKAELESALRRRHGDLSAVKLAAGLAFSVLGPFLIGHFLMRQTFVLRSSPAVYVEKARGIWDHFVPTYLAGMIPIALSLGIFLVARTPWRHRVPSVAGGWVLLAATVVFLLPVTMSKWGDAERVTVAKLRETSYPLDRRAGRVCTNWDFLAENGLQQSERWQVYLTATQDFSGSRDCNLVKVYRGWRFVGSFALPELDTFTGVVTVSYPSWDESFTADYNTTIFQTSRQTGQLVNINPIATAVELPTAGGRLLSFTLDGAGSNDFQLR